MTVTLNIQNDAELRAYIKDLIKGQVLSIIRDEVKNSLKDVLEKKVKDTDIPNVSFLIKEEINKIVKRELDPKSWGDPSFVKAEARKIINDYVNKSLSRGNII